jgi:hypothetical protein
MVGDARLSAGWLLPMICIGDLWALFYWRKRASFPILRELAPWAALGLALGAAALTLPERILRPAVGAIILGMLAIYLRRRFSSAGLSAGAPPALYGSAAGFASTVANAAGPVMNLFLFSRGLAKEQFVATSAWFFFVVNGVKLPIYGWHGLISRESLLFDAWMAPILGIGAVTGRWVLHRIPPKWFEIVVLTLTVASTLLLFRR